MVICKATAVQVIGRISPGDAGLWKDAQVELLLRINRLITNQGAGLRVHEEGWEVE